MGQKDVYKKYEEKESLWNEFMRHPSHSTIQFKIFLTLAWLLALCFAVEFFIVIVSLSPRLSSSTGINIGDFYLNTFSGITICFTTLIVTLLTAAEADKVRWAHFQDFSKSKSDNK